ncbi:hypothetical protein QQ045_011817 [Rhodiola kirilowii]
MVVYANGLKTWNEQHFGKVKRKIKELQGELSRIQEMERTDEIIEPEVKITRDMDEWFLREELLWKQRSMEDWLKEGGRNIRFFHHRASHRKMVNRIEKLKSDEGEWITEKEEICGLIVKYYEEMFRSNRSDTRVKWNEWMRSVPRKLNEEMRNDLMRLYSEVDVKEVVFQMCQTQALGLDGFSVLFYQKSWSMVKEKVSTQILRMLNSRMLEDGINKTLITLFPKVKDPKTVREYIPISLCNVGVKIVTKMLANGLKPILPTLSRRIKELLSQITDYQRRRKLKGVKNCRGAPEITHMLFADGIIFFLRANLKNAENLKKVIEEYEILSGQKVNLSKSEIYFGRNITESERQRISATLGLSKEGRRIYWCKYGKLCKDKMDEGVGFKELSIFNDALLAKQIWRLMEKLENLVSRLLRMKYYRDSSPISCKLRNRPSLVWRSIWTAGQNIKQWIQISGSGEEVRWTMESDGRFSTRSAHKTLLEISDQMESNQVGEQAHKRKAKHFWKVIWKINVQPKVRLFAWRLFHDYLPSAVKLAKKGMRELGKCPVCGLRGETTVRTLLYCWWAHMFWKKMKFDYRFLEYEETGDWLWWLRPRKGVVKINVDGAWDSATKLAGVGISCRDEWGYVCFVEAFPVDEVGSCLDVEQKALARAMMIGEEEKLINVTFEIDNVQVMKTMMQGASFGNQKSELTHR